MDCLQYLWAGAWLGWPIQSVCQKILISGRIALKGFLVDTENMESSADAIEPLLAHIGIWSVCGVWGGRFPCLRCCWCCIVYSLTNDAERLASRARFAYQPPKHQSSDHIHEIEVGCWSFQNTIHLYITLLPENKFSFSWKQEKMGLCLENFNEC